LFVDIVKVFIL